jgi:serine/threonine protein kinase
LGKAGQGGFGDVFIVDENFVVKRIQQLKKDMLNPLDKQYLTQTVNVPKADAKVRQQGENEFERLMLSQHENVIQVYATTTTDNNSLVIVLDRAKFGDLMSYYEGIIQSKQDPKKVSTWHPHSDVIDAIWGGIASILPWSVIDASERMFLVFQLSSALKVVHMKGLLHRDLKP